MKNMGLKNRKQQFSNSLSLLAVCLLFVLLYSINSFSANSPDSQSQVEAFVCHGDCVIPSPRELAIQEEWRKAGFGFQKTGVFLNQDGSDPRKQVKVPDEIPGVGRVAAIFNRNGKNEVGFGSGSMINECIMLTNRHVIDEEGGSKATHVFFESGENFSYRSKGEVIEVGNYTESDRSTYHADYAFVKLDKAVLRNTDGSKTPTNYNMGDFIGTLPPLFRTEDEALKLDTKDLTIAGLIADEQDRQSEAEDIYTLKKHEGCSVKSEYARNGKLFWYAYIKRHKNSQEIVNTGAVETDCSSLPGSSGSPIIKKDAKGQWRSVGIAKNSTDDKRHLEWSGNISNIFIPFISNPSTHLSLSQEKIDQIIRDNPCPKSQTTTSI